MKYFYMGRNKANFQGIKVWVSRYEDNVLYKLELSDWLAKHLYSSKEQFSWGHEGQGSAKLAFAILNDACSLKNYPKAARLHILFMQEVIAKIPKFLQSWTMSRYAVLKWLKEHE